MSTQDSLKMCSSGCAGKIADEIRMERRKSWNQSKETQNQLSRSQVRFRWPIFNYHRWPRSFQRRTKIHWHWNFCQRKAFGHHLHGTTKQNQDYQLQKSNTNWTQEIWRAIQINAKRKLEKCALNMISVAGYAANTRRHIVRDILSPFIRRMARLSCKTLNWKKVRWSLNQMFVSISLTRNPWITPCEHWFLLCQKHAKRLARRVRDRNAQVQVDRHRVSV